MKLLKGQLVYWGRTKPYLDMMGIVLEDGPLESEPADQEHQHGAAHSQLGPPRSRVLVYWFDIQETSRERCGWMTPVEEANNGV